MHAKAKMSSFIQRNSNKTRHSIFKLLSSSVASVKARVFPTLREHVFDRDELSFGGFFLHTKGAVRSDWLHH